MKRIFLGGGILAFLCMWLLSWSQEILDGIVAVVGEEIILRTELLQMTQGYAVQMGINIGTQTEEFEKLKQNVLQDIINKKVLLAKAKEDTITVEDQRVEAEMEARIQNLIQQLGSKEKVEAYFGSPVNKIKRAYREEIRKDLISQTVQQEKLKNIFISRREVKAFYQTMKDSLPEKKPMMKLCHILIGIHPGDMARLEALDRIRDIRERLSQGESFEELARRYSEDPGTAEKGGELGFVERGTLFQSFEEAGFKLEPGEISDIVETPIGLHLIQMMERQGDKAKMRHILIRLAATSRDEEGVRQNLINIRERLLAGEDFGELVREYSEDLSTKENGGDLGWLPAEDLQIQAFKSAVDTLEVGEISFPFQTQFGYHIVKIEEKELGRKISLEEDWQQIKDWALNVKRQKALRQWVEELKKDIYIEIKDHVL